MLPVVIPMNVFKIFTYFIHKLPISLNKERAFSEFSSLIETLVLSDQIYTFNVGAYNFEWKSGQFLPGKADYPGIHPYSLFHNLDFVSPLPGTQYKSNDLIEQVSTDELNALSRQLFENEKRHPFTIWHYISTYTQAYNGYFGDVTTKQLPLIKDLIPNAIRYKGSLQPINHDPIIHQSYEKLSGIFNENIKEITRTNLCQISIPPLTALVLSRLPNNLKSFEVIIGEILALRDELRPVREKYSLFEDAFYNNSITVRDMIDIQKAINVDSDLLKERYKHTFYDNIPIKFLIDSVSLIVKLLSKSVSVDDVVSPIKDLIPDIVRRISVKSPTLLYNYAIKAESIRDYDILLRQKLGIDFN